MRTFINRHLTEELAPIIKRLGELATTTEISEDDLDWLHSAREDLINISGEYAPDERQLKHHLIDQSMEYADRLSDL